MVVHELLLLVLLSSVYVMPFVCVTHPFVPGVDCLVSGIFLVTYVVTS